MLVLVAGGADMSASAYIPIKPGLVLTPDYRTIPVLTDVSARGSGELLSSYEFFDDDWEC